MFYTMLHISCIRSTPDRISKRVFVGIHDVRNKSFEQICVTHANLNALGCLSVIYKIYFKEGTSEIEECPSVTNMAL